MPTDPIAHEFTESMDTASKHIVPPAGGEDSLRRAALGKLEEISEAFNNCRGDMERLLESMHPSARRSPFVTIYHHLNEMQDELADLLDDH